MAEESVKRICLFVGKTGAGKSSIIKGMLKECCRVEDSWESVVVDHGNDSCTQEPNMWDSGRQDIGIFMDTRGTDDSKADTTDEDLLRSPMRKIHKLGKTVDMRVVWCTLPETRKGASLQTQARFIQSIFNVFEERGGAKVGWDSVMIVVQRGDSDAHANAVVAAARECGCEDDTLHERVVMGDVLEWGDENDSTRQTRNAQLMQILTDRTVMRNMKMWTAREFVSQIFEIIAGMQVTRVDFGNDLCHKCGQQGDVRFFEDRCHGTPVAVHCEPVLGLEEDIKLLVEPSLHEDKQIVNRHGNTELRHPEKNLQRVHKDNVLQHASERLKHGEFLQFHPEERKHGKMGRRHVYRQRYHGESLSTGNTKTVTVSQDRAVTETVPGGGGSNQANALQGMAQGASAGASVAGTVGAIGGAIVGLLGAGSDPNSQTTTRQRVVSESVDKAIDMPDYYPCCGAVPGSLGCLEKCGACGAPWESRPCRRFCEYCDEDIPEVKEPEGCLCASCGGPPESGGCQFKCRGCKKLMDEEGCLYEGCGCGKETDGCRFACCGSETKLQGTECDVKCENCGKQGDEFRTEPCVAFCQRDDCGKPAEDMTSTCIQEEICGRCDRFWDDDHKCTWPCCGADRETKGCTAVCELCNKGFACEGCGVTGTRNVFHDCST